MATLVAELDLRPMYVDYERRDGRGHAAYRPEMMTRLLLYAYAVGQTSSRGIEQATHESIPFRFFAASQTPDHTVIAAFRQRHLASLARLFVQVLQLCENAASVTLGHIAIDGAKIQATATRRRSVSYTRLSEREQYWHELVKKLMAKAQQTDSREPVAAGETGSPTLSRAEQMAQAEERLASEEWGATGCDPTAPGTAPGRRGRLLALTLRLPDARRRRRRILRLPTRERVERSHRRFLPLWMPRRARSLPPAACQGTDFSWLRLRVPRWRSDGQFPFVLRRVFARWLLLRRGFSAVTGRRSADRGSKRRSRCSLTL